MDVDGASGSGARRLADDDRVVQVCRSPSRCRLTIAQEYDLFFSAELSAALTLLQFPQRPVPIRRSADETPNAHPLLPESISTDEAAAAIKARLKPSTNTLELSIPLENPSEGRLRRQAMKDYGEVLTAGDLNASSELAAAATRRRTVADKPPLEAMVLRGQGLPDQTNYCAMVLIGGAATRRRSGLIAQIASISRRSTRRSSCARTRRTSTASRTVPRPTRRTATTRTPTRRIRTRTRRLSIGARRST